MKTLEADMNTMVELAVANCTDDLAVSRAQAISQQVLSPAPSYNKKLQPLLVDAIHRVDMDDYPELHRRLEAALGKVTHFDSGAPFVRIPRMVLHVGPGLDRYVVDGDYTATIKALQAMTVDSAPLTGTEAARLANGSLEMVAPETMRNAKNAVLDILKAFRTSRQAEYAVLTVVTFSEAVVQSVIVGLIEVGLHLELAICLHQESGPATVHRTTDEGYLMRDWPIGVLQTYVDRWDMQEIGYTIPNKSAKAA